MLTAEARVATTQSSRYLVALCKHFHYRARTLPGVNANVEWSDDRGLADFGFGRCTLAAESGVLTLRAEAPDEEGLQRVQLLVAAMLERMGKRDRLQVTWDPPPPSGRDTAPPPPHLRQGSHQA